MGALHEGHAALAKRAAAENDRSLASVFVNPTQFAPTDDLDAYPRALERDLETLEHAGADACFAPREDELYAEGAHGGFRVVPPADVEGLAEASARPGHFAGVCTVVAKLWNLARPDRSYFGQKDALQCAVLRRLHADLCFPGELVVCDTQRADDGLALSSRNAYLNEAERRAPRPAGAAAKRSRRGSRPPRARRWRRNRSCRPWTTSPSPTTCRWKSLNECPRPARPPYRAQSSPSQRVSAACASSTTCPCGKLTLVKLMGPVSQVPGSWRAQTPPP